MVSRFSLEDVLVAAKTVYGEARGESFEGKVAVAWVLLNRANFAINYKSSKGANHPLYGDGSLKSACLAPWQFSCWNDKDPNSKILKELEFTSSNNPLKDCLTAVVRVLEGDAPDLTKGSKHYHTTGVKPVWSKDKTPTYRVGTHLFFNNIA